MAILECLTIKDFGKPHPNIIFPAKFRFAGYQAFHMASLVAACATDLDKTDSLHFPFILWESSFHYFLPI